MVGDALKGWSALEKWGLDFFASRLGSAQVQVNDRSPARLQDLRAGCPQQTVSCSVSDYVTYCLEKER